MKPNASTLTRNLAFIAGAALLALAVASPSGAGLGPWDRITFSGPVALPGVVLPTGAYVFEVATPTQSPRGAGVAPRHATGLFRGVHADRPRPADLPGDRMVIFGEASGSYGGRAGGDAGADRRLYPNGRSQGHRFIYRWWGVDVGHPVWGALSRSFFSCCD